MILDAVVAVFLWISSRSAVVAFPPSVHGLHRHGPRSFRSSATIARLQNENTNLDDAENDFRKLARDFMKERGVPTDGIPSAPRPPPSKTDVYSDDDLKSLLDLHKNIQKSLPFSEKDEDLPVSLSLHEQVLAAIEEIDADPAVKYKKFVEETPELREKLLSIRAIATDVDGTLLTSDHKLHPVTMRAVEHALEAAFSPVRSLQVIFPATGKSQAGALGSLGDLGRLLRQVPGVFSQGLVCVDAAAQVVWESKLDKSQVVAMEALAENQRVSLFCYDGNDIYCNHGADEAHVREFHDKWGEPEPIRLSEGQKLANHAASYHKCLVMDYNTEKIAETLRPRMEALADELGCAVTQAIPTMVEFLPASCNKALGVKKLCEHLGMDPATELLAIGDAENDIEMLEMAAVGVAVGNADPRLREVADIVLDESSDEGGAGIAIELFGLGEILR